MVVIDWAWHGQVALSLLALLIIPLHHESRQSLMRSDFGVACCLRQWMSLTVAVFSVLAARMLYALVQDGPLNSNVIATWFFPVMVVGYLRRYEPLRMRDLKALRKTVIKERWFRAYQPTTVVHAFQTRGRRLQVQSTLMRIVPDSDMMWNVDDRLLLWFRATDDAAYDQLAGMLRKGHWKVVCVCDTVQRQFCFILRGVLPSIDAGKSSGDSVPANALSWYCQWLESLLPGDAASSYQKYYDEMMALKLQMTTKSQVLSNTSDSKLALDEGNDENQIPVTTCTRELASMKKDDSAKESNDCLKALYQKVETSTFKPSNKENAETKKWEWVAREPTDTEVIVEWLYERLFARVRWSKTFAADIQNMLDECSKTCGYRYDLVELAKVRNSEELRKEFKSLETVFICFALQNITGCVDDVVAARDEFLERCKDRVSEIEFQKRSEGILAVLQSLGSYIVADILMLTFLLLHATTEALE